MLNEIKRQLNLMVDEQHFVWVDNDVENHIWNVRLNELIDNRETEPVFLISYETKKDFLLCNPDMPIIDSPLIYWVQLPVLKPLSDYNKEKYSQEIITAYLKKIKQSRLRFIEKLLKHELANEFSPIIMAKYCFTNNIVDKETYDIVKEKFEQRKGNNYLNNLLKQYFFLTDLNISEKQSKLQNENHFKRYPLKVLLIDDFAENGFYDIFKKLFKKTDYFTTYHQAEKFISEIKDNYIPYDLIICDLNLKNESADIDIKERSGYKIIKALKETDFFIPIILFTSSEKTQNYLELKNIGLESYVNKLQANTSAEETDYVMNSLFNSLEKISQNGYVHKFYYAYNLYNQSEIKNFKIADKLYTILLKLYNSAFYFNTYHKKLNNMIYNEILLYIHNIVTDIIQETDSGCCFEHRTVKDFFKNSYEQNILSNLNHLRNSINLIHGNSTVDLTHVISYLNLIFYLLLRNDHKKLCSFKNIVKEMLKITDNQRNDVKNLKRLWQITE